MKNKTIKPQEERFEIKEECNIKINARNIDACDINARNIHACDIDARNIHAGNIDAWDIIRCRGKKLHVKETLKAKVIIVYDDCDVKYKKLIGKLVRIKRS